MSYQPIALNESGNFVTVNGLLSTAAYPPKQYYEAEVRCQQNTYTPDTTYGRNPIVWSLSQSPNDRIDDLIRIGQKYLVVKAVTFDSLTGKYNIYG